MLESVDMTSIWIGERVRLRGMEPDDAEQFMGFDADTDDKAAVSRVWPPQPEERYRAGARERASGRHDPDNLHLAIEALETGELVGSISTADADQGHGRFWYAVHIGRPYQRRGYAGDAVRILLGYMFNERRFHKCETGVYSFNEASVALHRKLGFVEEGRQRDHVYIHGRFHDCILFGMRTEEFPAR